MKCSWKNENEPLGNIHHKQALFQSGDLVWVHLRKERFPSKRKCKFMPRANGPFEVPEKVGDNAYKVELPGDYGVSCTCNITDLKPHFEDDNLKNLRQILSWKGTMMYHERHTLSRQGKSKQSRDQGLKFSVQ